MQPIAGCETHDWNNYKYNKYSLTIEITIINITQLQYTSTGVASEMGPLRLIKPSILQKVQISLKTDDVPICTNDWKLLDGPEYNWLLDSTDTFTIIITYL